MKKEIRMDENGLCSLESGRIDTSIKDQARIDLQDCKVLL